MKRKQAVFKGKKFLLTHWALAVLGGSENNIIQMAEYIKSRGGEVEFFTYALQDPVKSIIDEKGIKVSVDDIDLLDQEQKTQIQYDLRDIDYLVICQNVIPVGIIRQLNNADIKTQFIFFHMSSFIGIAMESPLFYDLESLIASRILSISEETTNDQLERLLGANIKNLTYYRNPVPDNFIDTDDGRTFPKIPKRIAIISNHPPKELTELAQEKTMKENGIEIELIGRWSHNPQLVTAALLREYDAVISIGKTVQYCLVMGLPVYVYDRFGGQGYIKDYDAAKRVNFSGRDAKRKTTDAIAAELVGGYQAATAYQSEKLDTFRKDFLLSNVIESVFSAEKKWLNNKFSEQYINYLISEQLLLKEKNITMVRASVMQAELSEKSLEMARVRKKLTDTEAQLKSLHTIKRSARLLAGNIKRRIFHG